MDNNIIEKIMAISITYPWSAVTATRGYSTSTIRIRYKFCGTGIVAWSTAIDE